MTARWYVLHVYSGFEQKISDSIMEQAGKKGIAEDIEDIMIPTEEVVEMKRGKRTNTERRVFPGYILIKMELSDLAWNLIKNTDKVTGFLGGGRKPVPISQREAEQMMKQLQEGVDSPRPSVIYDIGEELRVTDGPFASFTGMVEEIDEEKQKLKVSVSIFGRATPVELDYSQVEKV
jgi:transcriptional antiterminator NusG